MLYEVRMKTMLGGSRVMGYCNSEDDARAMVERLQTAPRLPNVGELAGYANAPEYSYREFHPKLKKRRK